MADPLQTPIFGLEEPILAGSRRFQEDLGLPQLPPVPVEAEPEWESGAREDKAPKVLHLRPEPVPGPAAWDSAAPGNPRFEPPVVTFDPGPEKPHRSLLMLFAHMLKLDVWGWWGLNRRAAVEMESAAVILLSVYAFEFLAWGLLFNVIIHGSTWVVSPLSGFAALLAFLFATVIFVFEKSFVTADFSQGMWAKFGAYVIRVTIILASAMATSQPVELMVFGDAIDARLYEETVRAEALREAADVQEARERSDVRTMAVALSQATAETREYDDWREADQAAAVSTVQLATAETELAQATADVEKYTGARSYWKSQKAKRAALMLAAPNDADLAERSAKAERYYKGNSWALTKAEKAQTAARVQAASAQASAAAARGTLNRRQEEKTVYRESLQQGLSNQADRAREDLEGRVEWMDQVMSGNHRSIPVQVVGDGLAPLTIQHADFTQRLAILADLRAGRPARWPASSAETRMASCDLFGLCDEAAASDPVTQARSADAARTFRMTYWAAFIIAVVIPLLTLAFKLLMPRELKAYYSTVGQARSGNPAAVKALWAAGEQHLI
jgi:hypothetical protein